MDSKITDSQYNMLEVLGLAGNTELNKVAPGLYRKEFAYLTATSKNDSNIEIPIQRSDLLPDTIDIYFTLNALGGNTGAAKYKPIWDLIQSLRLTYNNSTVVEFNSDTLFYESVFMLPMDEVDAMSIQKNANFAVNDAKQFSATNDYGGTLTPVLRIPNIARFIQGPISSYMSQWKIVIQFKPFTTTNSIYIDSTTGNDRSVPTTVISDIYGYLEGYRISTQDVRAIANQLKSSPVFKFVFPTMIQTSISAGNNDVTLALPSIRGRLSNIVFWIEENTKSGNKTNPLDLVNLDAVELQLGTAANPTLYTNRNIKLKDIRFKSKVDSGITALFKNEVSYTLSSNPTIVENTFKYVEIPIYNWEFSDSSQLQYKTAISNGSIESVNDIQLNLIKPTISAASTLKCLVFIRRGIKLRSNGIDTSVINVELDPLKTESK